MKKGVYVVSDALHNHYYADQIHDSGITWGNKIADTDLTPQNELIHINTKRTLQYAGVALFMIYMRLVLYVCSAHTFIVTVTSNIV